VCAVTVFNHRHRRAFKEVILQERTVVLRLSGVGKLSREDGLRFELASADKASLEVDI
jgi:hypothetical protein